jgi:hypothetical protein
MKDLKEISKNPYHIFKMLRQRLNKAYQHKLEYILKPTQNGLSFNMLTEWQEVFKEITDTYKDIFNNPTEFTAEKQHWMLELPKIPDKDHSYLRSDFILEEMTSACTETDPLSSAGNDNITNKMLQLLIQENTDIQSKMLQYFNSIKVTNYIPLSWKGSMTTLIHKPGADPHSVNGYRPISLLNTMYKIYTAMLNKRITMMIDKHTLIPNTQNGFRPTKETTYCINALISQIKAAQANNMELHAIYVDFAKAFDSVPYWAIQQTMSAMNFDTLFIDNVMELFSNTFTQFKTTFGYTDRVYLSSGVRQGDTISPTLFILSLAPLIYQIDRMNLTSLPSKENLHLCR